jgi:hypothetical protein
MRLEKINLSILKLYGLFFFFHLLLDYTIQGNGISEECGVLYVFGLVVKRM